jgi:uncharacterized protein YndB with AHSA1/START domain
MKYVDCSIEIKTTPEKIIRAFVDDAMLKAWWGVERSFIEAKTGGLYTITWGISIHGIKYISTGLIKIYDETQKLHIGDYMYLSPDRPFIGPINLIIEVTKTVDGSLLNLKQGPYPQGKDEHWDWYYQVVNEAWPGVLQTLKQYLEKR